MAISSPLTPSELVDVAQRLSSGAIFRSLERHTLARMLVGATRISTIPGDTICTADEKAATAMFVLLEGMYEISGFREGSSAKLSMNASGGAVMEIDAVLTGSPYATTIKARTAGLYVSIAADHVKRLLERSPSFREALAPVLPRNLVRRSAAIVRFESQVPDAPLSLLIELLAREIASSFPEHVLIVRRAARGASSSVQIPVQGPGRLACADLAGRPGRDHYDYIFVDPSASGLDDDADIVVKLLPVGALEEAPIDQTPWVLQTMVVTPKCSPRGSSLSLINANWDGTLDVNACRVLLDLDALRRMEAGCPDGVTFPPLDDRLRRSLGVWARALTRRRTGLAIAGGGVYAMEGVYVIQQLLQRNVPIDVITATSGGSLVGAYYAALGPKGLDKLLKQADCGVLNAVSLVGSFSGQATESFYACALGAPSIECLEYTDFYPAISNLANGTGVLAVGGPLALGVRASGSATPVFPATVLGSHRLVDGAYSNNLPAQALWHFNTRLRFALNVYPPARFGVPPWLPQCVSQLGATINPINRGLTFLTAFSVSISIGGDVQGDCANVRYNATSISPAPYLFVPQLWLASEVVERSAENQELQDAINCFAAEWEALRTSPGGCAPG